MAATFTEALLDALNDIDTRQSSSKSLENAYHIAMNALGLEYLDEFYCGIYVDIAGPTEMRFANAADNMLAALDERSCLNTHIDGTETVRKRRTHAMRKRAARRNEDMYFLESFYAYECAEARIPF